MNPYSYATDKDTEILDVFQVVRYRNEGRGLGYFAIAGDACPLRTLEQVTKRIGQLIELRDEFLKPEGPTWKRGKDKPEEPTGDQT